MEKKSFKKISISASVLLLLATFSLVSFAEAKVVNKIPKGVKTIVHITGVVASVTGSDITVTVSDKKTGTKVPTVVHNSTSREIHSRATSTAITSSSVGKMISVEGTKNSDGSINALNSRIIKTFSVKK